MKLLTALMILLSATFAHAGTVKMSEEKARKITFTTDEDKQVIKIRMKTTMVVASCNQYRLNVVFGKVENDPYTTVADVGINFTESLCPRDPKTITLYSDVYEMTLSQWASLGNVLLIPNGDRIEVEIVP